MFELKLTEKNARRGQLTTPHGVVQTPVFMNVGTQAAIKGGLSSDDLVNIDCQVELSNTYHLHLRPGEDIVRQLGGLHGFMKWERPILTDSGGFQVFSLAKLRKINEEGVQFSSHIDGHRIFMRPEDSIDIQLNLGADIIMAFDECVANPSPYEYVKASTERTSRWLTRCKDEWLSRKDSSINSGVNLWGINQGGVYEDLRIAHMKTIAEMDLPGYSIGGLAVGETAEEMYNIIDILNPIMPVHKPRYLMGVGTPVNILEAVYRGVDFFDCVLPARNARHGHLYTWEGCRNIKNEKYSKDASSIDENCGCPVCSKFSRAFIRHLFKAEEILAMRLSVMHNLYFYNSLMRRIRDALDNLQFEGFYRKWREVLDKRI